METPADDRHGVTEPRDTDVLCGRGGAALRHPGNQTYRRLVNLNKGLYITCLKTEKLKISRSIVAAIREQKGRFLEKDNDSNVWYDIGDKKAVEKTSQALREGQPRLRKKINEMGGGVAGTAAFMESQYGHAGLYNPEQVGLTSANTNAAVMAQRNALQQQDMATAMPAAMPPPDHLQTDRLMQRLSLSDVSGITGATSIHSLDTRGSAAQMQQHQQRIQRLRPSLTNRASAHGHELGIQESQFSLMSEFSAYGTNHSTSMGSARAGYDPQVTMNDSLSHVQMETSFRQKLAGLPGLQGSGHTSLDISLNSMDISGHTPIPVHTNHSGNSHNNNSNSSFASGRDKNLDRRRVFARMKYDRPPSRPRNVGSIPSYSQHSDGLSDFNMVESSASLFSNLSHLTESAHPDTYVPPKPIIETAKVVDHSRYNEVMGAGSRHSIMSGLSRISDTSIDHSIFSDLSRKIGNVSTRSLAMSEMSMLDLQERDNESTASPKNFGATIHLQPTPIRDEAKNDPPLEFQL